MLPIFALFCGSCGKIGLRPVGAQGGDLPWRSGGVLFGLFSFRQSAFHLAVLRLRGFSLLAVCGQTTKAKPRSREGEQPQKSKEGAKGETGVVPSGRGGGAPDLRVLLWLLRQDRFASRWGAGRGPALGIWGSAFRSPFLSAVHLPLAALRLRGFSLLVFSGQTTKAKPRSREGEQPQKSKEGAKGETGVVLRGRPPRGRRTPRARLP